MLRFEQSSRRRANELMILDRRESSSFDSWKKRKRRTELATDGSSSIEEIKVMAFKKTLVWRPSTLKEGTFKPNVSAGSARCATRSGNRFRRWRNRTPRRAIEKRIFRCGVQLSTRALFHCNAGQDTHTCAVQERISTCYRGSCLFLV